VGTKASGSCLARRTWGTVARDWQGSKDIYSEWSKLTVELLLGGLNSGGLGVVGPGEENFPSVLVRQNPHLQ